MDKELLVLKDKSKNKDELSRNQKRKAEREYVHFETRIAPIIDRFETIIFDELNTKSYKSVYSMFLEFFVQIIEQLNLQYKIIEVSTHFFSETYKPLECGR